VLLTPSALIRSAVLGAARGIRLVTHGLVLPQAPTLVVLPPPALVALPEVELAPSAWDPEPQAPDIIVIRRPVERTPYVRRTPYEEELLRQEVEGCRGLMLELIRRAAFDWVLYRSSTRLLQKQLAEQAFEWLFVEAPGHPSWALRVREEKVSTSFLVVCEQLGLDPDTSRAHIRKLTPRHVMSVGRPTSYRTRIPATTDGEDTYSLPDGMSFEEPTDEGDTFY